MPAPKVDLKKFAAHMARNKKPTKMTSTQKSLSDISKRANETATPMRSLKLINKIKKSGVAKTGSMAKEDYKKEYQRHVQGRKDAAADMKRAKTNDQMVKAMNKKAHHDKALSKMNRMESVNEMGPRHTSKPMKSRFGGAVDSKRFDVYKKFVKQNNVDEPTVRMVIDNPNDAESKRMMKNKNIAKAVDLRKAAMKESIQEKLSVSDGMGAWIDDFKKSDAPQFKDKDSKERRDMAIAAYLSAKRGAKNEAKKIVITKKMQQRALSKVRAQPKDKVSLAKAPWEKEKKEDTKQSADRKPENYVRPDGKMGVRMVPTKKQVRDEGYVSAAQRKAVWATRADGGKGHPDKKGKK